VRPAAKCTTRRCADSPRRVASGRDPVNAGHLETGVTPQAQARERHLTPCSTWQRNRALRRAVPPDQVVDDHVLELPAIPCACLDAAARDGQ
jgi:hypothetical protein